jgi:hypothetical protein
LQIFGHKIGRFCVRIPNIEFFNFTAIFEHGGIGLEPVPVFDGSTAGTDEFGPVRFGSQSLPSPGRVHPSTGTRSRPFDGFDGCPSVTLGNLMTGLDGNVNDMREAAGDN